jgi:hypothetical protein
MRGAIGRWNQSYEKFATKQLIQRILTTEGKDTAVGRALVSSAVSVSNYLDVSVIYVTFATAVPWYEVDSVSDSASEPLSVAALPQADRCSVSESTFIYKEVSMSDSLTLHFEKSGRLELVRTDFKQSDSKEILTCIRGKTPGAFIAFGSFQWTSAVRAVAAVAIRFAIAEKTGNGNDCLIGGRGSLAASLDYALSKGPTWIQQMFGTTSGGAPYAKRLFRITNPNRKRPGPVALSVNRSRLDRDSLRIFCNGQAVTALDALANMLQAIESEGSPALAPAEPANELDMATSTPETANS